MAEEEERRGCVLSRGAATAVGRERAARAVLAVAARTEAERASDRLWQTWRAVRDAHSEEEVRDMLEEAGPELVALKDKTGRTLLHYASWDVRSVSLRALLEAGADPNAANGMGITPVHFAAMGGRAASLQALLEAGGDISARTASGASVLNIVCSEGFGDVADVAIAAGAPLETRDASQLTPLQRAAQLGHAHLVRRLLAAGADMEARSLPTGRTAAGEAAAAGKASVLRMLLAAGADATVVDKTGRSLTRLARRCEPGVADEVEQAALRQARRRTLVGLHSLCAAGRAFPHDDGADAADGKGCELTSLMVLPHELLRMVVQFV